MSKTPHTAAPADEDAELVARMVEIANRDDTTGLAADALREGSERLASKGADDGLRGVTVPPLERPDYCEPHEFLLLSSYCGDDNDECTEKRPCSDCLAMCNVFGEDGKYLRALGLSPPQATGSEPQ